MPLKEFLDVMFSDQPIDYEINNKTIFIKKKNPGSSSTTNEEKPAVKETVLMEITGIITNAEGAPLEGATITIKGTRTSVVTNASGKFTINAQPDQTLIISFIGYKTEELKINSRTTINLSMEKAVGEIEQVVVTALGITKKTKSLTYNVQEIKGDELNKVKDANFINSLNGKVAGATINSASSGVGGW